VEKADRAQVAVAAPDFQSFLKIHIAIADHDVGDVAGPDPKQVRGVGQLDRDDLVAETLVIHIVVGIDRQIRWCDTIGVEKADARKIRVADEDFDPVLVIHLAAGNRNVGDVAGSNAQQVRRVGQFDRHDFGAETFIIRIAGDVDRQICRHRAVGVEQRGARQVGIAGEDLPAILVVNRVTTDRNVADVAGLDSQQERRVGQVDGDDFASGEGLVIGAANRRRHRRRGETHQGQQCNPESIQFHDDIPCCLVDISQQRSRAGSHRGMTLFVRKKPEERKFL
jgi:hypothetical protein